MNRLLIFCLLTVFFAPLFFSCEDMDDKPVPNTLKVNDFVWKGLNLYYYWQEESPDLLDTRFATQRELNVFLSGFSQPEDLFNHLRVDSNIDRFSVIYNDYAVLEGILQGTTKNNGVDYELRIKPGTQDEVFGWVRYIMPNSDASGKDIQRGDVFYAVNGTQLNRNNFRQLLGAESYILDLADYDNGNITPNGRTVSLTKTVYSENPVLIHDVYEIGTHKIGYIMYNGFYRNYETQLNAAFGTFKNAGVTDLVLDLRYNSGGAVITATRLAGMITGQFTGQLFATQQWNRKVTEYYEANNPGFFDSNFVSTIDNGTGLNSLNLSRVYVLTTQSSASASELVINGLEPYIDVIQIGTRTSGKNVGSVTLYDSPTFGPQNKNNSHRYAMQPITFKIVNKDGFGEYQDGLLPDFQQAENLSDVGVLGDVNEPLLATALALISGSGRMMPLLTEADIRFLNDAKSMRPFGSEMYLENAPLEITGLVK